MTENLFLQSQVLPYSAQLNQDLQVAQTTQNNENPTSQPQQPPKPDKPRYKQTKEGDITSYHRQFVSIMDSHSAIYSGLFYANKKRLSVVPRNLLDILSVRTTSASLLLKQEQSTLLWINDRKLEERLILIDAVMEEPGLNEAWIARLEAMKSPK